MAFTSPLEVSGILFVLRIFGWLFFLFRFFLEGGGGWFIFLIEAIPMTLPQFSNTALQTVKSVLLRGCRGLATVAGGDCQM